MVCRDKACLVSTARNQIVVGNEDGYNPFQIVFIAFANLPGNEDGIVENDAVAHCGKRVSLNLNMNDLSGTGSEPEIDNPELSIGIFARQVRINDNDITAFVIRDVERGFPKDAADGRG